MITFPVKKYDARHDVYDTDEIVGFKILDYRRNVEKAQQMFPQYDFSIN